MNPYTFIIIYTILISSGCVEKESKTDIYKTTHTIKCTYPGYTTPDFGPEREPDYLIDSSTIRELKLVTNELMVDFSNSKIDSAFHENNKECPICYYYYLKGDFSYNKEKKYYIILVDSFRIVLDCLVLK